MSADLLRQAAAKLRETSRPIAHFGHHWTVQPHDDGSWLVLYTEDHPDAGLIAQTPDYGRMDIPDWIALMHPGVAEPLAELLDLVAVQYELGVLIHPGSRHAVAVARAIVGEVPHEH